MKRDLITLQDAVADDPWKLLIAVTLLNKTSGRLAIPVFWEIIDKWPTPWALSQGMRVQSALRTHQKPRSPVNETELSALLRPLGTQTSRAKRITNLSRMFLQDPPKPSDLRLSRPTMPSNLSRRRDKYPPTPISHLPGAGPYALDSYRVFCTTSENPLSEEWKAVMPSDKELIRYLVCCYILHPKLHEMDLNLRNGNGRSWNARNGIPR